MPVCSVILTSSTSGAALVKDAAASGASFFIPKQWALSRLVDAISEISQLELQSVPDPKKTPEARPMPGQASARSPFDTLTAGEIEVFALLSSGATIKEISNRLGVSQGTVRNRISRILRKTGARSGREAAAWAREIGFLRS